MTQGLATKKFISEIIFHASGVKSRQRCGGRLVGSLRSPSGIPLQRLSARGGCACEDTQAPTYCLPTGMGSAATDMKAEASVLMKES